MTLLVDIGNTRIKWARLVGDVVGPLSAEAHANWTSDDLKAAMIRSGRPPTRVVVSNVGGPGIASLLRAAVLDAWQLEAQFVESSARAGGVQNAYAEPAKLGVDRWMALIGARALKQRLTCIVSVGTAMTVDALNANGRHLGGLIVPGPDLMVGSLLRSTSEIAWRAEGGTVASGLLADNTLGAITQGTSHALAALVERTFESLTSDQGEIPEVLVTGGAASRIESLLRMAHMSVPDLVLRGLAVVARETA